MARLRLNPKISVSVVFVSAMFMAIMDITIVNVALPTLGREFHVRPAGVEAVVVAFLVSLAVFIPASGWLGDRFGTKRVLLTAIVIFTGASVLCGLAQSLTQLVLFRILQGVGGGMLTPVGMAMLFRTFPPHERIRASRILVTPTALAPALGPVVGGLLVTELSWRWVFYVNVPIGLFALAFGFLALDEHREPDPGRFDLPGFILAGAGLASVMYAVSEGAFRGWGSTSIVVSGLVGAALLAVMVVVELRQDQPMVDLRLFTDRLFRTTTLVFFVAVSAFLGTLFVVALFFQDGLGASPLLSGLSTFPEALGVMLGAQVATRIYPRIGPRRIIAAGLTSIAVFTALMSLIGFGAYSLWEMRILMFVLGYSMAHVFVPSQAAAFATISSASTGRGSTLFNANRQLGSAVGVALLGTILATVGVVTHTAGGLVPNLSAYHLAFATAAVIALLGAVMALAIKDSDAAPSMRKPEEAADAEAETAEREPATQPASA
ncbi:MAG: multidrug efflux MFS transporter [Actinobacteria bacterium]|nr:MAG: multidrug efflux MFS transporter [Actinomycetota bacterium]